MAGYKLSIADGMLAAKRATQGASSNKLTINDVNYLDRASTGPDGLHRSINDLWLKRWTNNAPRVSINDGMYTWFGFGLGPDSQHRSNADIQAARFHVAGYP